MISIAICDDTVKERDTIRGNLERYLQENHIADAETDVFSHPDALLESAARKHYDLFLLDIIMPMMSGIDAAKDLLVTAPSAQIIFISTTAEFAMDAFTVNALSYLLKPYTGEQFDVALRRAMARILPAESELVLIKTGTDSIVSVGIDEIIYVTTSGRDQKIILTEGKELIVHSTMLALLQTFEKFGCFVKCGASLILNLKKIRRLSDQEAVMRNGELIHIPRREYTALKNAYLDFYNE